MKREYKIFPSFLNLADSFARYLAERINSAALNKKYLTVALSGGQTPQLLFSVLAERYSGSVDWNFIHLFWVDERCVPPDDPESNFGMAKKLLLDRINIPEQNIHRMKGEADPVGEAERYSQEIEKYVGRKKTLPVFDIIILGVGDDGHAASIFPGDERLFLSEKLVSTAVHPVTEQRRITLTGKVINNAEEIYFIVTGTKKKEIVKKIFRKGKDFATLPAAQIKSIHGKTIWLLDTEAARNIMK